MNPDIDYDSVIFGACPNYENAIRIASSLVLPRRSEGTLSLGTGTGNLEQAVMGRFPDAKIFGIDWNEQYLEEAKRKLGENFAAKVADVTKTELPKAELVVSGLTIHHLGDSEKKKLFKKIYESLQPGGRFINYDIVKARTPEEHEEFVEYVTGHMKKQKFSHEFIMDERRILNGIGEGADNPMHLDEQKQFLEGSGFNFSLDWKDHLFVVYHCDKPL